MNDTTPKPPRYPLAEQCLASTHDVLNQPPPWQDVNLFLADRPLQEALEREGAGWARNDLIAFGELTGSANYQELGFLANDNRPVLHTHDRFGHRVDLVKFHPAYHQLMRTAIEQGLHASPWSAPGPGAHVARTAKCYLQSQVEAAHGCPITMTFAALPVLRGTPQLASFWEPRVMARVYDPSNRPAAAKEGVTIGMAMTEKQGGSDVRANTTRAHPLGPSGPGEAYELVGHKFFVSAPMCDAFLVLAQAPGGLSCFLLPRWRPDGSKNPLQIQRLKNKMGNVANASSETELRGALAWLVGEEGRGVRTIIDMVALTRFDCIMGSAAGMRMALTQALHHSRHRAAFSRLLVEQPLMQNVLADLALESEAALALTMRLAGALDRQADEKEALLVRLGTALGKYWVCKRTPGHAYEAMECIGGSGVMEDCIMPRLFRESPVNAIWEGSGNVQCLDLLRIMQKTPAALEVFVAELDQARGHNRHFDNCLRQLHRELADPGHIEYRLRKVVERMALAWQGALLIRQGEAAVADAFCAGRLQDGGGRQYGTLPHGVDCRAILARALAG